MFDKCFFLDFLVFYDSVGNCFAEQPFLGHMEASKAVNGVKSQSQVFRAVCAYVFENQSNKAKPTLGKKIRLTFGMTLRFNGKQQEVTVVYHNQTGPRPLGLVLVRIALLPWNGFAIIAIQRRNT